MSLLLVALLQSVTPAQVANVEREAPVIRGLLESELLDYPAARFRHVYVTRNPGAEAERGSAGPGYLCGEINSPNPMGGYSGWQRFAYIAGGLVREGSEVDAMVLDNACGRASVRDSIDRSDWIKSR